MTGRVLVAGATGTQGGAVARALRDARSEVVALVRDPGSDPARALARDGIALATGDLDDPATLAAAIQDCTTVFSVQAPGKAEPRHARNLLDAARKAGVTQLIHASVSATGWRSRHPDLVIADAQHQYWDQKEAIETMVREAGFDVHTILKPAFHMENFIAPKAAWLFPLLIQGELPVATSPDTRVPLIAAADVAAATVAAVADPHRFAGAEIELGGDLLTFPEIAAAISDVTGHRVSSSHHSVAETEARFGRASWAAAQSWYDTVGYAARPHHAAEFGLPLTTFDQWARQHQDELRAATPAN